MEAESLVPSVSLMPGMLPAEELFWHWRKAISPYFESVPLADPRDPPQVPKIHMYNPGGFLFMDTVFSGQKFIRDASWLRRNDDSDHVGLQIYLRGRNLCENGGSDFELNATGIFAVNLGYEIDATASDAECLSVIFPRHRVMEDIPALAEARGLLFDTRGTSGKLLAGFIQTLRETVPMTPAADAAILTESLIGMLRALMTSGDAGSIEARAGVLASLQRYVDCHLGDDTLGVESICAHFQMSRATLYRLLQPMGGVREYIQRRRLMGVFRALTSTANTRRGIFDIALEYGFSSPSHLSSRFRERFGMSPSEAREAAHGHPPYEKALFGAAEDAGLSDAEIMERWSRELRSSVPARPAARH